ncbi:cytosolic endo-beta-N-acetylglucosaminidase 1-like [Euphorbia lathyris]|uniref:cytosolic endo-beta-N-acetylglucosaminidase 1-like n=1 Tax=Euphorbia lathyris TaxID=212925 RepID=UPI00331370F7
MCSTNKPQTQSSKHDPPPPPFDPLQPSIPISYPIKTLEELASRAYFESFHYPFNKSSVPLRSSSSENRGRTLVCHDFKGGYTDDDKWIQGGINENAYAIWHWYLIDVFVYFAHYLVTLPPPSWTNAAHTHGVKMLGTFITEGTEGRKVCDEVFATKESAQLYAERLAELAANLGFDGWLMNMEVALDVEQIPNLKEFVSHLTQVMHSSVPGSLVIWYDSVTITGELSYQNQLNDQNKPFFDICDGIFANYWWEEDYPKQSAVVAGDRKFDVYMGVDVWGRGTYGGGQWNTNVALDVCKKSEVSTAIFAPGWVYETDQPPDFQTAQNKWWGLVEKSWGLVKFYPNALPFYSNFDQGHGFHISVEGGQVSNSPWTNISSQAYQPFLEFKDTPKPDSIQVSVDFKEASYSGGGNIVFKGTLQGHDEFTTRLFQGNLLLGELPLYITYSVKSDPGSLMGLTFHFSSASNENTSVLIAPHEMNKSSNNFGKVIAPRSIGSPETAAPGWIIQESSIEMNGYTLTEIHAVCYRPKPETRNPRLGYLSHDSAPNPSDYYAAIGDIRIKNSKQNPNFPSPNSWLVEAQNVKWNSGPPGSKLLNVKIVWNLKDGSKFEFSKYNIFVEKIPKKAVANSGRRVKGVQEYVGAAYVEAFYVSDFSTDPSTTSSLKFIIQACSIDGVFQKRDDSPFLQLDVEASHQVAIAISDSSKKCGTDATLGRRYIKHKDHQKLMWFDDSLQEIAKNVIVEMVRRIGKLEREIICLVMLSSFCCVSIIILSIILEMHDFVNTKFRIPVEEESRKRV